MSKTKILIMAMLLSMVASAAGVWAAKRQKVAPSYAWTISEPLGLHFPAQSTLCSITIIVLPYRRL